MRFLDFGVASHWKSISIRLDIANRDWPNEPIYETIDVSIYRNSNFWIYRCLNPSAQRTKQARRVPAVKAPRSLVAWYCVSKVSESVTLKKVNELTLSLLRPLLLDLFFRFVSLTLHPPRRRLFFFFFFNHSVKVTSRSYRLDIRAYNVQAAR